MPKRGLWYRLAQSLIILIVLYYVVSSAVANWQAIRTYDWQLDFKWLSISVAVMVLAFYIQSSVLSRILKAFSFDIGPIKAFKIAYLSQLGRYVPGKLLAVFGVVHFSSEAGIPGSTAIASFILHQVYGTPPALVIIALSFYLYESPLNGTAIGVALPVLLIAVSLLSLVILFRPVVVSKILSRITSRLGYGDVTFCLPIMEALAMLGTYTLGWFVFGLSFALMVISLSPIEVGRAGQLIGIYCAAYLIGFWSVLTPGGIGVREASLTFMLTPIYGPAFSLTVAAFARLWSVAGEIIASIAALPIKLSSDGSSELHE